MSTWSARHRAEWGWESAQQALGLEGSQPQAKHQTGFVKTAKRALVEGDQLFGDRAET